MIAAAFDPIPRLSVTPIRKEADHLIDAGQRTVSDFTGRSLSVPDPCVDVNAHKITDLEPRLSHMEPTNIG